MTNQKILILDDDTIFRASLKVFLENQRVQETTAILLEALKGNRPDEAHLQTRLFEINLQTAPNVAEGIF